PFPKIVNPKTFACQHIWRDGSWAENGKLAPGAGSAAVSVRLAGGPGGGLRGAAGIVVGQHGWQLLHNVEQRAPAATEGLPLVGFEYLGALLQGELEPI